MKKYYIVAAIILLPFLFSCNSEKTIAKARHDSSWSNFNYPEINFVNKAEGTEGWNLYHRIVPDPQALIRESILGVVKTLYWSSKDSIPAVRKINYTYENIEGISAKGGSVPEISIFYSSQWVEKSAKTGGDEKVLYETKGVLYHELTHGFQLEPQGIGNYGNSKVFWAFIEGMADAVRAHNHFFPITNRKPGGNWLDGYQTTGFFLDWLTTKDADFLRKFNRSTLEVVPWSFDGGIKYALGKTFSIEALWKEYQEYLNSK